MLQAWILKIGVPALTVLKHYGERGLIENFARRIKFIGIDYNFSAYFKSKIFQTKFKRYGF